MRLPSSFGSHLSPPLHCFMWPLATDYERLLESRNIHTFGEFARTVDNHAYALPFAGAQA